jgi:hypothetical protein
VKIENCKPPAVGHGGDAPQDSGKHLTGKGANNMPTNIRIKIGAASLSAELFDTECAKQVMEKLPIEAVPHEWGDEFYFEIPVEASPDQTATTKIKAGDIGYWPPGNALAIFFGPTPMSRGSDPVPASPVNLVGRILGEATVLREGKGAGKIIISRES